MDRDKTALLRNPNFQDLFPDDPPSYIEEGTVGWDGEAEYYELGTADNAESGQTLVRVQLFRGKPPHVAKKDGVGQGYRLLCRIGLTPFRVPAKGTPVLVAFPGGNWQTPGNPVIISVVATSPTTQFASDRVVFDFGPDVHVVIRGKSVSLMDANSPARFIGVGQPRSGGTPGCFASDTDGSGWSVQVGAVGVYVASGGDAKSLLQLTPTEVDLIQKGTTLVAAKLTGADGNFKICGANFECFTSGGTLGATAATGKQIAWCATTGPATPSATWAIGV